MYSFIIAIVLLLLVHSIWKRSRNPYGLPQVMFNWPMAIQFIMWKYSDRNRLQTEISRYRSKLGDLFVYPLFGTPMVVLSGDEALQWATKQENDDYLKRYFIVNIEQLLGSRNFDVHNKSYWKKNREQLSPILMKSTALNNFLPIMSNTIQNHFSKITQLDANTLAPIVFDIAWLFIVGNRGIQYKDTVAELYRGIKRGMFGFPLNLPGSYLRKGLESRVEIGRITREIMESDPTSKSDTTCCISSLNSSYVTEIEQKVMGLLFASHETTYSSISGMLWSLINNTNVLEKLQKEIRESQIQPTTIGDFQHFPYLNNVIHETLRIYGIDSIIRETKTDLSYKNHFFPKGTCLILNVGYDHMQVKDADVFDPDREDKYKWDPFGMGPRNCLGKVFAQTEMKMIMYHLLKNFDVKPEKDANAKIFDFLQIKLQNARLKLSNSTEAS